MKTALFLLLVVVASFAAGCASSEPENISERPWNAPASWENGMPGMMPQYQAH